ncbi:MAG: LppX_LprAFG lipoprotein [Chloroflexi bacterium]|nr:LppX_LprAFG lipoprotein [Chloroflexota bacterium]
MIRRIIGLMIMGVGLSTAVSACNNSNQIEQLPPETILQNAATRMNQMAGFQFNIAREGAPAYLDPDEILSFRRATGAYAAPDKAAAAVRVIGPAIITDVDVISIGETQWQTNVATGAWEELPPNFGFNPTTLFDPQIGLQTILLEDMTNLQLAELQNLKDDDGPDQELYHLTGEATGERLYEMSGTLIGPAPVIVELWILPETFELVRVLVTEPIPDTEETSLWQVDFANFDEVIEILPPGQQ